eukprot:661911-Pelagomonas_calceolata.AAC.1
MPIGGKTCPKRAFGDTLNSASSIMALGKNATRRAQPAPSPDTKAELQAHPLSLSSMLGLPGLMGAGV